MNTTPKKYLAAVEEARKQVREATKPYLGRIINAHYTPHSMVEEILLCSHEEDAGEGRHQWRGMCVAFYTYPIRTGENCSVAFAFSEDLVASALGMPVANTWEATANVLARLLPPLDSEGRTPIGRALDSAHAQYIEDSKRPD